LVTLPDKGVRPSDAELVQRSLCEDDGDAFGELVERYKGMVMAQALHIVREYHAAEDAAQETFVKAYRSLSSLERPEAFAGWLSSIARNTAVTAASAKKHASLEAAVGEDDAPRDILPPGETGDPEVLSLRRETVSRVLAAVDELPPAYRSTVFLKYLKGYTCAEIAEATGEKIGVTTSRLTRANAVLREKLADIAKEGWR